MKAVNRLELARLQLPNYPDAIEETKFRLNHVARNPENRWSIVTLGHGRAGDFGFVWWVDNRTGRPACRMRAADFAAVCRQQGEWQHAG
jgi:hypothetical protein